MLSMDTASKRLGRIVQNGLLIIYSIFALFPLLWMLILSIKSDAEMYTTTFLFSPTLDNYKAVLLESDYLQYMLDSLIVAGGAVIVSVIAGVPAAYALARYNFKKKEDIAFQILSFKFAPEILVVLPLFMVYQMFGIYDSYFGLIWVYQLISMPLLIWVVRGYFEDISVEIEYAAQVDGYSWYQIFFKNLVPLIKPGLVSAALLAFIFAWNCFTFPLMLGGTNVQPITVAITKFLGTDSAHYGQLAVAATISALPAIIFALCIQKHLVRGLSFGAVKG
ncbi:ABC transporter, permease protein [[Clostridium] scindens ATCC 35704]|nr:ABC transporter, permease protein [[Clostridium] scindens ATCC 35704]MBS5696888.1 carbohydrate ABC transporter permease [Lachnospiraceae bacterium]MSS41495.1 carbohydrate ABC transporter permease [[Clostridium] scindens]QRO36717.1 carbohydrate ABC transporter permease [[Clostridium] scindens]